MKKITFVIALIAALSFILPAFAEAVNNQNPEAENSNPEKILKTNEFSYPASSYILAEASGGRVLAGYNIDEKIAPASLTKIMLLLLVAEEINAGRLNLSDEIVASANASRTDGSVIWLEAGEVMTAEDLIKSVVMASANDAAKALAEHISNGSEKDFIDLMNRKASTLGMKNTRFTNVVGFDEDEHYSTARDVAIMSRALMREENYALFSKYMLNRLDSVRTGTQRETQLLNTNKLITYYNGIEGIKTGTTDKAGYCLSASALRGDMRLISVVAGCSSEEARVNLTEEILDYGFNNYELYLPQAKPEYDDLKVIGGVERTLPVTEENGAKIVIPKGRSSNVKYEIYLPEKSVAPIAKNQPVGNVTASLDGEVIYESYIVAVKNIEELTFLKTLEILTKRFFSL